MAESDASPQTHTWVRSTRQHVKPTRAGLVLTTPPIASRDGIRVEVWGGDRWDGISPQALTYLPATGPVTGLRGPLWTDWRRVRITAPAASAAPSGPDPAQVAAVDRGGVDG